MRIMFVGDSEEQHIAKFHEGFRKGLRSMFDTRIYGKGYEGFAEGIKDYRQIKDLLFNDSEPDLLIASYNLASNISELKFEYEGIRDISVPKAIILSDFWNITENYKNLFADWVENNGIDYILSQYPRPIDIYSNTSIADRFLLLPICIDPEIMNDWGERKKYDIGFLGCGITEFHQFYPERNLIHNKLSGIKNINYLSARHPGYSPLPTDHPMIGRNFSRLLNSCKMHVVTGSRYRNPFGKYFETMASNSLLLGIEPEGWEELGFVDGYNYVKVSEKDIVEKVEYYLSRPELISQIAQEGYNLAMKKHTCYARALELSDKITGKLKRENQKTISKSNPAITINTQEQTSLIRQHNGNSVKFAENNYKAVNEKTCSKDFTNDKVLLKRNIAAIAQKKLHLGCGNDYWKGYINIDVDSGSSADLIMDIRQLEEYFEANSIEEIVSIHSLNYLRLWEARDFFNQVYRILKPNGKLIIETVNIESAIKQIIENKGRFDDYLEGIRALHAFGLDDMKVERNFTPYAFSWSPWHISEELSRAGYCQVKICEPETHAKWRDMRVIATKNADPGDGTSTERGKIVSAGEKSPNSFNAYNKCKVLFVVDPVLGHITAKVRGHVPYELLNKRGVSARIINLREMQEDKIVELASEYEIIYLVKIASLSLVRALREKTKSLLLFDLTDALWKDYHRECGWQNIEQILSEVHAITTDNIYVADYAKKYTTEVFIVPTAIDIEQCQKVKEGSRGKAKDEKLIIGWIGSEGTSGALNVVYEVLDQLAQKYPYIHLRVLGANPEKLPVFKHLDISVKKDYDEAEMICELAKMDVGIFPPPLDVEDYVLRGALKARIFMSAGVPVVCQKAGECETLIIDGVSGMLAENKQQWFLKLEALITSSDLRNTLGQKGLESVIRENSFENVSERLLSIIMMLITEKGNKKEKLPRILLIADVSGWIFERHCKTIIKYLSAEFDFDICYMDQAFDEDDYDLIYPLEFNLVDFRRIRNPQKYVTGIRSHWIWEHNNFEELCQILNSRYQRIHTVSNRLYDIFKHYIKQISYVTHGVDSSFFGPSVPQSPEHGKLRIGWAGNREVAVKGFKEFIEPLSLIPGVELVFVGFKDTNLEMGEMLQFYNSIDVYICASVSEGNNNSLLEAASMERAIITTDTGTVNEYLINGHNAIIVKRELPEIISAVEKLRDNPDFRIALGKEARKAVVEKFDWKQKIEDYRDLFRIALNHIGNSRKNDLRQANSIAMEYSSSELRKRGMNIVHINTEDYLGGAARVAYRLSESQCQKGHNPVMFVGSRKSQDAPFEIYDVFEKQPTSYHALENAGLLYYSYQKSHGLTGFSKVKNADILHLHNLHGGYFNPFSLIFLSAAKPLVWTLHDMQAITGHCAHSLDCNKWETGCGNCQSLNTYPAIPIDTTSRLYNDKKLIYKNIFVNLVSPSYWLKSKIEKSILSKHSVEVIHNGVNTSVFKPLNKKEIRAKHKIPDNVLIVGCVAQGGVQNEWKGGYYAAEVIKSITERNKNVVFLNIGASGDSGVPYIVNIPFIADETMLNEVYSLLDVFLFTSIAENCPLVILEALSCGIPIVSFNTGGVPELVRNGIDGFITGYKNTSEAIHYLEKILQDDKLRMDMGKNARENAVTNFDHDLIAARYEKLYLQTIDEYKLWKQNKKIQILPLSEIPSEIKTGPFLDTYRKITENELKPAQNSQSLKLNGESAISQQNNPIKVSAIVSTYNSEKFMRQCLEDLVSQTLYQKGQLEIIIVNTASQQNEETIVREFENKYSNIIYIKTDKRETVYQAWNRGIKAASGKYITNANTDDRHRTDALEIMADELDANSQIALVYGNQLITKNENESFENNTAYGYFLWPEYDRMQLIHASCCGPQPMWRKSLHAELGYFQEEIKIAADYEWWLRISEKYDFKHIDQFLGLYLLSDESVEHKETDVCDSETRQIREYYARKAGLERLDYITYQSYFLKVNNNLNEAGKSLPLVSVIIPTFNRPGYLKECIQSVISQNYKNLEIIIINDAGCDIQDTVRELSDDRIRYFNHEVNKGLAAARNTGIKNANGKYIAYLDDDDIYYPHHIETLVNYLESSSLKVAYNDAYRAIQKLKDGKYETIKKDVPFSREFSRDMLLHLNIAPVQCFMHAKAVSDELGLFEESLPAHEDWEYWIRLSRKYEFKHLKIIASEFRHRTDNTNMTTTKYGNFYTSYRDIIAKYYDEIKNKPEIVAAQKGILDNIKSLADKSEASGQVSSEIMVSIVIPVFNKIELTRVCLANIYKNTPAKPGFEVIIVDNNSTDGVREFLQYAAGIYHNLRVIFNPENYGFAKANNIGAKNAKGKYLVCLNNDTEPQKDWLESLLNIIEKDNTVGAVGSKLLFPDGTIQHAGLAIVNDKRINDQLVARHLHYKEPADFIQSNLCYTCQALTGACLMINKSLFDQLGGFDEGFWNGYEDVDLCYRIGEKGYKLVYQPKSIVIHHESQSGDERFSKVPDNIRLLYGKWLNNIQPDYIVEKNGEIKKAPTFTIRDYPPHEATPERERIMANEENDLCSIIVLTFNGLKYNREFVNSVIKYSGNKYELIIVDNASTDGTVEYLKKLQNEKSNVKVIFNSVNLGFPIAVNQAIKAAKGNYVLIANNDIVVTNGWLERMISVAESSPEIGIVGPVSNAVSGVQLDKNAKYKNMTEMQKYAKKVSKDFKGQVIEFPRVAFLCTLIKKEVIDAIGGLDERFTPGNYEDDDYCLRAQKAGYKAVIARDVFIHHYGSKSFKANGEQKYAERLEINKRKFVDKWGATIEEIWLEGKPVIERSLSYPINTDEFMQNYERALVHFSDEEFEMAEQALKHSIELYEAEGRTDKQNEYGTLLNLYGNLYLMNEDLESARDYFGRELKVNPQSASACLGLGEIFYAAELYKESKEMFQWAVKNEPSNSSAAAGLARANQKMGLSEDHNSLIEVSVEDGTTGAVWDNNGSENIKTDDRMNELITEAEMLVEQNKLQEAVELLDQIIRENPKNTDALNNLAVVSILTGDLEAAADFIQMVVEIDPANEVALDNMNYLSQLIDSQLNHINNMAESTLTDLTAEAPADLPDNDAISTVHKGRYNDLIEKAEEFIENSDLISARKMLETVLLLEPENTDALNNLSVIEIMEKNYPAAVEIIERVISRDPENEVATENLLYFQRELDKL
ncbi:MAG: glycosyltransferase [Ignavibacteriales bacterium]